MVFICMPFCCKTVFQINTHLSALFGKESCRRQPAERLETFCLRPIFVYKSICFMKVNPSDFSYEKLPPFTCYALWVQGRQGCGFLGLLFLPVIWCKQVVCVQTCGLHRRSMNAPTDLFYRYIGLWLEFDIKSLLDNPSDGWRRQLPLHSGAYDMNLY